MGEKVIDSSILHCLRESFGRVVYTHKTHEKAVDGLNRWIIRIKWCRIVLIALAGGTLLQVVLGGTPWLGATSALTSALALALTLAELNFNPSGRAADHRRCAKRLWHIRERYIHLISDVVDGAVPAEEARCQRDALTDELAALYAEAPDTTPANYRDASLALKLSGEMTFSADEIDQFLPERLRITSGGSMSATSRGAAASKNGHHEEFADQSGGPGPAFA